MERTLRISKIREGIVIDHIPGGKSLKVLSVLNIGEKSGYTVSVAMFVQSNRMKTKDVLKIESRFLEKSELDRIALIAPDATISVIKNYEISEKFTVEIPKRILGILKCNNQNCITNGREPIRPEFELLSRSPLVIRCIFCERNMGESEIHSSL
ncbi:MAG: aspartate carbamoyltransferase regulatory subunit [Candidatus Thermoplasmatota archaeon]|nr:aspartate carbamoyltransferase regulatory subunit [Candidatus Thermoplasmatota archaeon]MCL5665528.1 aspartate carbamoyltransferase regulatory subunit [Candidatus Thermoplasmatota archaeon]